MKMKSQNATLSLLIAVSAVAGDYLVFNTPFSTSHIYRGIIDNLVHALIGLFSSYLFLINDGIHSRQALTLNVMLCTSVSSLIDIDHVVVAKSIYWKDLKNFSHRGIFHCSSVWFLISIAIVLLSFFYKKLNYHILGWMLLIAFTSHHIRDANRRGFWIWPCGHTQSLPKAIYILLLTVLPYAYFHVYMIVKPELICYKTVSYHIV